MEAVGGAAAGGVAEEPAQRPALLRRLSRDPGSTLRKAVANLRARWQLRGVDALGPLGYVYGRIRVRHGEGRIAIADRLLVHGWMIPCELSVHSGGTLEIGSRVFMNYGCNISAHESVRIGDDCLLGQEVIVMDCDFHGRAPSRRTMTHGAPGPVRIGDRVWLGARVMVLKGVSIGDNTIVAAGSVVTTSLPANVIAAGVPARVLGPVPED